MNRGFIVLKSDAVRVLRDDDQAVIPVVGKKNVAPVTNNTNGARIAQLAPQIQHTDQLAAAVRVGDQRDGAADAEGCLAR